MRLSDRIATVLDLLEQLARRSPTLVCATDSTFFITLIRTLRQCHDDAAQIDRAEASPATPPAPLLEVPSGHALTRVDPIIDVARRHSLRQLVIAHPRDVDVLASLAVAQHEVIVSYFLRPAATKGVPS